LKTVVLLAALTGLLLVAGEAIGGSGGLTAALIVAFLMNVVSYWFSDKLALSMVGARAVSEQEAPELYQIVARVASEAQLPMPRVYIVDTPSPNAFATGRDPSHAAVAVTTGILNLLNWDELEGVLGHELAHVRNRDTLIATIAATLAGAITYLAQIAQWGLFFGNYGGYGSSRNNRQGGGMGMIGVLLMIVLAPLAALLIQLAISRGREYSADAAGARITGQPLALADALERLERGVALRPMTGVPAAVAPLFIVNPLSPGVLSTLFSDHPPTPERVARLRKMAYEEIR
jgi:heat shock protein HtpX